jgi:uncharacterized membrane protein YdbT with pleckstrin-like domain
MLLLHRYPFLLLVQVVARFQLQVQRRSAVGHPQVSVKEGQPSQSKRVKSRPRRDTDRLDNKVA